MDAVHAFGDERAQAARLAQALGAPLRLIDLHVFPDGESLPRVAPCEGTAACPAGSRRFSLGRPALTRAATVTWYM